MEPFLTEHQEKLFTTLGNHPDISKHFYLSGGTALSGFYLKHRYSEDLDFFSQQEVDTSGITVFLESIREKLGINKIGYQQSFNRNLFFLHFPDEILKTEFTYFPFMPIEKGFEYQHITIDSLLDIAVNKLFSIYQRTTARDYIDLYMICEKQGTTVQELIKKARIKFDWHIDPIQLATQFMKATEASEYPRMIVDLKAETWQKFFLEEAQNLKPEILE